MMNSNTDATNPGIDDFDDDDMSATTVLDKSSGNGEKAENEDFDETSVLEDPIDTISATDNVGDVSVEINVEELIADIEASEDHDAARKREIRRRLEEAVENRAFEDTYAIDFDEQSD